VPDCLVGYRMGGVKFHLLTTENESIIFACLTQRVRPRTALE
jgi:hypothetical protein